VIAGSMCLSNSRPAYGCRRLCNSPGSIFFNREVRASRDSIVIGIDAKRRATTSDAAAPPNSASTVVRYIGSGLNGRRAATSSSHASTSRHASLESAGPKWIPCLPIARTRNALWGQSERRPSSRRCRSAGSPPQRLASPRVHATCSGPYHNHASLASVLRGGATSGPRRGDCPAETDFARSTAVAVCSVRPQMLAGLTHRLSRTLCLSTEARTTS
jgi:hypothetical protein